MLTVHEWRWSGVTETAVLRQRRYCAECLAALVALDLHPTVGVHPLVPAQVGKLCVALETNLAAEWLDAAVDMCVLLQAAAGGKSFAAFRASVAACTNMGGPNVSL